MPQLGYLSFVKQTKKKIIYHCLLASLRKVSCQDNPQIISCCRIFFYQVLQVVIIDDNEIMQELLILSTRVDRVKMVLKNSYDESPDTLCKLKVVSCVRKISLLGTCK